jgi:hypothetical protein
MSTRVGSRLAGAVTLAGVVTLVAACGSGSGAAKAADTTTTATTAPATSSSDESQQTMSAYLQCLKDHGINVPVDANGNPTFGPRRASGPSGPSSPPDSSGTPPSSVDRSAFQQARQACGTPPGRAGGSGGGGQLDPQAAQQAALQFAACLREQGLNVADPDFSTTTTSPPTTAGNGNGGGFRGGGALGAVMRNLDRNDPTVQAAIQKCQANFGGRNGDSTTTTTAPTG